MHLTKTGERDADGKRIFDIMTALSKTLLSVSVAGFVAGSIIDFGGLNLNPAWMVALPLGAVFFGLSLISFMLEKEMAKFDEEEAKKFELIRHDEASHTKCKNCNNCKCQTISAIAA